MYLFKIIRTCALVGVLFLLLQNIYCQKPHLQFKYITPDEGLSSSTVNGILEDSYGFMWIATSYGLNRYDGSDFKTYNTENSDPERKIDNIVNVVFEDIDSNLWIGTNSGVYLYNRKKDNFLGLTQDSISPLFTAFGAFQSFAQDSSGNLWIAGGNMLIKYKYKGNTKTFFVHDKNDKNSISNNSIQFVFVDSKDRVWISTREGLNLYNSETDNFYRCIKGTQISDNFSGIYFNGICEDKNNSLWIGSNSGLFQINDFSRQKKIKLIHHTFNEGKANNSLYNEIRTVYADNSDRIWAGTAKGLFLFEDFTKEIWHYKYDTYNPKTINNELINCFYEDLTGNIWIGTFAGGINISHNNGDAIQLYTRIPGASASLSHNSVLCFLQDSDGEIWIGTDGGGINRFYPETGKFFSYTKENSSIGSNSIISITEDKVHNIWLGSWQGGLICFNKQKEKFISYTTQNSEIPDNSIFSVIYGFGDDLWLGSFQNGLIHYNIAQKKFESFTLSNSEVINSYISVVRKDNNGNLYLGSSNGFQIFNPEFSKFTTFENFTDDTLKYLSNVFVNDILIENDTSVWIGTGNGLNNFNPATNKITYFFTSDGLPNNSIKSLSIDDQGILWVTTNDGVCRFDYKNDNVANFNTTDGFQSNEFNAKSRLKTKNGELLLGGPKGFNVVIPEKVKRNQHIPNIIISKLEIFNRDIGPKKEGSVLDKEIYLTKKLTLTYDQSVLTFHFAILDYTAPEKNQYAYMLEGFDKSWIYSGNKNEVTYTNLNPGNYLLRVKGSNNDCVWNNIGTSLEIVILPPWWKTIWFRILLAFLVFMILLLTYFYRIHSLEKQKTKLELEVINRTKEISEKNKLLHEQAEALNETNVLLEERQQHIEEQSEELATQAEKLQLSNKELTELNAMKDKLFSIIAHDLKNPFNTILGFSELLQRNFTSWPEEKNTTFLGNIYDSTKKVYHLLENLLTWSRSQRGVIPYNPQNISLNEIIQNTIDLVRESYTKKGITVEINVKPPDLVMEADYNMIYTVIRNVITNAIKYSSKGDCIKVIASEKGQTITIEISDTGIGMDTKTKENLFKVRSQNSAKGTANEQGTGLGLIFCKEFINRHQGNIEVKSEPGKGSTFIINLPVKQ